MTFAKAEKINGCLYRRIDQNTWGAFDAETGELRASAKGTAKRCAFFLVEEIYRQNRMLCLERAGWKCERCGYRGNLTVHHKRHRKMGGSDRDDRLENLEVLCQGMGERKGCHEGEHGG